MSSTACLVGTWSLRSDAFLDQIVAAAGSGQISDISHVGGDYLITLNADVGTGAISGEGTYECTGDVLVVNVVDAEFPGGVEASFDRVG